MDPTPGAAAGRHDDRHPLQPGPRVCEFPDAPGRRRRLSTHQHPPSTGNGDVYDHSIDIQTAEFGIPIPNSYLQYLRPNGVLQRVVQLRGITASTPISSTKLQAKNPLALHIRLLILQNKSICQVTSARH